MFLVHRIALRGLCPSTMLVRKAGLRSGKKRAAGLVEICLVFLMVVLLSKLTIATDTLLKARPDYLFLLTPICSGIVAAAALASKRKKGAVIIWTSIKYAFILEVTFSVIKVETVNGSVRRKKERKTMFPHNGFINF